MKEFDDVMIHKVKKLTSNSIIGIDHDNIDYKLDMKCLKNSFGDNQDTKQ